MLINDFFDYRERLPPSYTSIPTILAGRLAVDSEYQSMKIGKYILLDALKRSLELSKIIGSSAVVVDPLDDAARAFYNKYGFIALVDRGKIFMPMSTVSRLFVQ